MNITKTFRLYTEAAGTGGANVASATGTIPLGYASVVAATGATTCSVILSCELLTLSAEDDWLLQDALDAEMEKPGREECWVEDHNP